MTVPTAAMTPQQRAEHRAFWRAWVERAQTSLGALLAETIDVAPAVDATVYACVDQLIDVEQQLSAVVEHPSAPPRSRDTPLRWSRLSPGHWRCHGYEIKRDTATARWRVLRDGVHWDLIEKLPDAKRACERDGARRRGAEAAPP